MGIGVAVAFASLLITTIAGFGATMRSIGRLEQKFDLVWEWYIRETSKETAGGRRRYDGKGRARGGRGGGDYDDGGATH